MSQTYRYEFREGVSLRDVEDTLLLARLAGEAVFGEARVHLDAVHSVDRETRALTVDVSNAVGRLITAIFTTFALREFGRAAFTVRRQAAEVAA